MFVEPVLKQMTLQRVAVDVLGVVGVLVCLSLFFTQNMQNSSSSVYFV
jgi:hypothetical protein